MYILQDMPLRQILGKWVLGMHLQLSFSVSITVDSQTENVCLHEELVWKLHYGGSLFVPRKNLLKYKCPWERVIKALTSKLLHRVQ